MSYIQGLPEADDEQIGAFVYKQVAYSDALSLQPELQASVRALADAAAARRAAAESKARRHRILLLVQGRYAGPAERLDRERRISAQCAIRELRHANAASRRQDAALARRHLANVSRFVRRYRRQVLEYRSYERNLVWAEAAYEKAVQRFRQADIRYDGCLQLQHQCEYKYNKYIDAYELACYEFVGFAGLFGFAKHGTIR